MESLAQDKDRGADGHPRVLDVHRLCDTIAICLPDHIRYIAAYMGAISKMDNRQRPGTACEPGKTIQ